MADKKPIARGRGIKPIQGPWSRSQKPDEGNELRRPIKEDEKERKEFCLTDAGFPPLPKAAASGNSAEIEKIKVGGGCSADLSEKASTERIPKETESASIKEKEFKEENSKQLDMKINETESDTKEILLKEFNNKPGNNKSNEYPLKTETKKRTQYNEGGLFLRRKEERFGKAKQNQNEPEETPQNDISKECKSMDEEMSSVANGVENPKETPSMSPIGSSFKLDPHAKEFIPQSQRQFNMNPSAQAFVPNLENEQIENNDSESSDDSTLSNQCSDLDETLNFCYQKITECPASFDECMGVVLPHLNKYLKHPQLIQKTASELFNFSLVDASFTYHAVRMLIRLMELDCFNGVDEDKSLRFRVLSLVQEEHRCTIEERLPMENVEFGHLTGMILFLAELYIQLEVSNKRLIFIGVAVVDILKKMLSITHLPVKEVLCIVVSTIKLTGTYLDEDDRSVLDLFLQDLHQKIVKESGNLDENTVNMVEHLIVTRNTNWGASTSIHNNQNMDDQQQVVLQNGLPHELENPMLNPAQAVFYGPDGNVLPYEEQMFLECNAVAALNIDQQSEPSPSSMDGEMQEAYQEFLLTIPPPMHTQPHMPPNIVPLTIAPNIVQQQLTPIMIQSPVSPAIIQLQTPVNMPPMQALHPVEQIEISNPYVLDNNQ